MINVYIRTGDGKGMVTSEIDAICAALRDPDSRFWVDIEAPADGEIDILDSVFGFHPLAIEDSIKYSQRPKLESYEHTGDVCNHGYFYLVFHGPDLDTFRDHLRTRELDSFVSERYLVTIHDEPMGSITALRDRAKTDPKLVLDAGIDLLLHNLLDRMVDAYGPILDHLQEELDALEDEALDRPKPDVLHRISAKKRELLGLRRVVGPQREVVAMLTRGDVPFIRESTRVYMRDVLDHLIRTVEMVELYRDLVLGARDIYLSSISNHLNQIMKTLTIISVIALPFTVVTGFFGMNFDAIPGLHTIHGFWWTVVAMVAVDTTMLTLFWWKRWI